MLPSRKKQVTDIFGTVSLKGRAITALYINPDTGERRKVQVPGTPIQKGYSHFSAYEAQFLYSEKDESIKLRYHPARPSSGGSSGIGAGGYLSSEKPARKKKAQNEAETKPRAKAEPFTGYRILINTADFSPVFNQKSGVYDVSDHGRLTNPEIPRKLKNHTVRSVKEIVDLIRFGDTKLLANSDVVFQNNTLSWKQFCIRLGTPSRHLDLLERLQKRKPGQEPPFALVEIRTTGRHDPTPNWNHPDPKKRGKVPRAPVDPIEITTEGGRKVTIRYDVYIDDQRSDGHAKYSIYTAGSYFVLAEVRHKQHEGAKGIVHYLSMKVTNKDQLLLVNIENIDRDARMSPAEKRAKKEAEKPGPITLPAFIDPYPLTGE